MGKLIRNLWSETIEEDGFTLIESITAVILVSLTVGGLFAAWYMTETRDRRLQDYWKAKESVELAYQITHQTIRSYARTDSNLPTIGVHSLSFTGNDGLTWSFAQAGNDYTLTHDSKVETLINGICDNAQFQITGNVVTINLRVNPPSTWTGVNDLDVNGRVLVRNP